MGRRPPRCLNSAIPVSSSPNQRLSLFWLPLPCLCSAAGGRRAARPPPHRYGHAIVISSYRDDHRALQLACQEPAVDEEQLFRAKQVFGDTLGLPAADVAAYLDAACAGDVG